MDEYIEDDRKFSPKKILLIGLIVIGIIILIVFLFNVFGNKKNSINYDSLNQDIIKATQEYLEEESEYKSILNENTYVSIPVSVLIDKNLLLKYDKTDKKFKELTDDMCEDVSLKNEKEVYEEKLRLCGSILIYGDLKIDEDEIDNKSEEEIKELLLLNIDAYDKNNKKEIIEEVVEIVSVNGEEEIILEKGENSLLYEYNDKTYSRKVIVGDYKSCIIEYKSNYGENKIYKTIKTEDYENVKVISSKPVRALHKFIGWSMDSQNDDVLYQSNENIACAENKEITLYAMWEKNNLATYKILYYVINGKKYQKVKEKTIKNVEIDEETGKITPSSPIEISGLSYNEKHTNEYYNGKDYFKVDLNGNITTIYFYNRDSHKITFDFKGGKSGTAYTNCSTGLSLNSITIPKRAGYIFEGYYLGTNGSNTKYYDKDGKALKKCDLTKDIILYANWKKSSDLTNNTATSTLVVNPNGGSWNGSSSVQSFTQAYSTTKYIAPPSRNGYTFEGWVTANTNYGVINGTTYTFGIVNGVTNTLTASWKEINYNPSNPTIPSNPNNPTSYELSVNPNGGSWNGNTTTQKFSQTAGSTKYISNPSRSGYTFGGWTLSGSGGLNGTTYTFGRGNGILTAKWNKVSGSISLGSTSGSFLINGSSKSITISGSNYGTLSCSSSNSNIMSCRISGTTLIVTPGSTAGTATITVRGSTGGSTTYTSVVKTVTLSFSPSSGTMNLTERLTSSITGSNYGTISIISNCNSNVASCYISGTTLTVNANNPGTTSITIKESNANKTATYTVTINTPSIPSTPSTTTQRYYYCNFCESISGSCVAYFEPGEVANEFSACSSACSSAGFTGLPMVNEVTTGFMKKYVCTCYTPGSMKGYCSYTES